MGMERNQIIAEERIRQQVREDLRREAATKKLPGQLVTFVLVLVAAFWFVSSQSTARHQQTADRASDALLRDIGATR